MNAKKETFMKSKNVIRICVLHGLSGLLTVSVQSPAGTEKSLDPENV